MGVDGCEAWNADRADLVVAEPRDGEIVRYRDPAPLARGKGAEGLGMFALSAIVLCAIWYVWLLVDARKVEGAQFKIYLIPFYFLFYIYGESDGRYLRAVTPAVLAAIGGIILLGVAYDRNPPPNKQPQTMWVERPASAASPQPASSP